MKFKTSNSFLFMSNISIQDNLFLLGIGIFPNTIRQVTFSPDTGVNNTGAKLMPDGIINGKIYFAKVLIDDQNYNAKLFLTNQNAIDEVEEFVFTDENLDGFYRCFMSGIFSTQNLEMPCVERASADVEDMFCCPPLPELITTIPEYLTLDTGSEDDSGNYYLATYRVMYSIPPLDPPNGNLYQTNTNLAYKSKNQPFEAITRTQSNIYQGPTTYGTLVEEYTLAWEIYTDAEIVDNEATGNIRLKVLCTIWSYGTDNGQASLGLKTIQEYYSDWVDKDEFDYSGTCTIVDNADEDFMFPSVAGYYSTPAGLPIPHSVDVTGSATFVVMPETVRLYMPDAVFVTPEGNIELGNIDEVLNYNAVLGGYYSDVKEHYLIQGRYFLPLNFYPSVLSNNPTFPGNELIYAGGDGLNYSTETNSEIFVYSTETNPDSYGYYPPLYFTNDIEERGPFVGSLSGVGAGYGGIFSGLDHGKPFIDSRAKVISNYTATATGQIINNEVVVTMTSYGNGYISEPTVYIDTTENLFAVANMGEGEDEGKVISITITNPDNETLIYFGNIVVTPPPPSFFDLSEKNNVMNLYFSGYQSYFKPLVGGNLFDGFYNDTTQHFYKNNSYYITSNSPDAFITSLDELDTPTIDEEIWT